MDVVADKGYSFLYVWSCSVSVYSRTDSCEQNKNMANIAEGHFHGWLSFSSKAVCSFEKRVTSACYFYCDGGVGTGTGTADAWLGGIEDGIGVSKGTG